MKSCKFRESRVCWDCCAMFKRMVDTETTGANIHQANNALAIVTSACDIEDKELYYEGIHRLLYVLGKRRTPPP